MVKVELELLFVAFCYILAILMTLIKRWRFMQVKGLRSKVMELRSLAKLNTSAILIKFLEAQLLCFQLL